MRSDLFQRSLNTALITDFFGGVSQAEVASPDDLEDYEQEFDIYSSMAEEDLDAVDEST